MAIVGKFGKPDIFLTFTCNPKHPDIVANLPAGQKIEHRPDVVARVFKQHLTELLIDITESHVLVAYVYVIEFQKRGLPHCHLLLILSHETKLRVPEDIDKIINAEIPSANTEPHLYEVIRSCMVHGPCGGLNPKSVCTSDGTCSQDYPKTFRAETSMRMDAYPMYRRRDNGPTMKVGQNEVDNRWIVPYSPYFSEKFAAHINVEACTTVKSVKYLFKYIYKGHDCATLEMNANAFDHDEVTNHLDARYLSAPEACWRLFEYVLHRHSHTIIRLPVHLPEQQMVYFREGQEQNAVANAATKNTMLTAFFKLNSLHPTANPKVHHLTLTFQTRTFGIHQSHNGNRGNEAEKKSSLECTLSTPTRWSYIVCVFSCFPFPVPQSTKTSEQYMGSLSRPSDACLRLHLLDDDSEWDKALEEASVFQMPRQLRSLFVTICIQCTPSEPALLWQRH